MEFNSPTYGTDSNLHNAVETDSSFQFASVISPRVPPKRHSDLFKTVPRDDFPGVLSKSPLSAMAKPNSRLMKNPEGSLVDIQHLAKPDTTNVLDVGERADLVRKSRKLTRVFGETPNAEDIVSQETVRLATKALGQERDTQPKACVLNVPDRLNMHGGRYSMPLEPDSVSFISISPTLDEDETDTSSVLHHGDTATLHQKSDSIRSSSPISFINLSDDGSSIVDIPSLRTPHSLKTRFVEQREREKRQKRERLAKLHRFLGSQVPADSVLGMNNNNTSFLPPPQEQSTQTRVCDKDDKTCRTMVNHHSSSVILEPSTWSGDLERPKAEFDQKERISSVRRAQKMEKASF